MSATKYTSIAEILSSVTKQHWAEYYDDMLPVVIAFAGTHPPASHKSEIERLRTIFRDTMSTMMPRIIPNEKERHFYMVQALSNRTNHTHVHILCLQHACAKVGGSSGTQLFQALMGKAIEDTPLHHVIDRS